MLTNKHTTGIVPTKACEKCGKSIVKSSRISNQIWTKQRFCSRTCAGSSRRSHTAIPSKLCEKCGNIFFKPSSSSQTTWARTRFCSIKCSGTLLTPGHKRNIGRKLDAEHKEKLLSSHVKGEHHPLWKGGEVEVQCQTCQTMFFIRQYRLQQVKYCSRACRTNDPKNTSPINMRIRRTRAYADWREAVFQRDNYTCQICHKRGGTLNADHIKPFALHPELRFDITNGQTLCEECHRQTDTFGVKTWRTRRTLEKEGTR